MKVLKTDQGQRNGQSCLVDDADASSLAPGSIRGSVDRCPAQPETPEKDDPSLPVMVVDQGVCVPVFLATLTPRELKRTLPKTQLSLRRQETGD